MSQHRSAHALAALILTAALTLSCSDDDGKDGDGGFTPDKAVVDASGLPDGYTLYKCPTPGKACNAHDACAINPICGQDGYCHPERLQNCDDNLSCTTDRCLGLGTCENKPNKGTCRLAVKVYGNVTCADLKKKGDAGITLDAGAGDAATAFMAAGDGGAGDQGAAADATTAPDSSPTDLGGPDLLSPTTLICCFDHGDRNPNDQCQACQNDGTADAGASGSSTDKVWSPANGGYCDDGDACTKGDTCQTGTCKGTSYASQCSDNISCTLDKCDGKGGCLGNTLRSDYCLINNTCYKSAAMHPKGTCQTCDPTKNQAAWTSVSNTCLIDNKCYANGSKNPVGCGECDPKTSTTAWTVTGSTCCLIKGANVKSGVMDSTKCSTCDPKKNAYGWTPLTGKCFISGTCYSSGDKHSGGCASCQPTVNATTWTITDGTKCLVANKCVPHATTPAACGKCGVACASGETCAGGKCSCGSLTGTQGGGAACASGQSCSKGVCVNVPADTYAAPFTESFETSKGKLTGTKDWEWGKVSSFSTTHKNCETSYPATPPKTAKSGTGAWGTQIDGCYSPLGNNGTSCTNPSVTNDSVLTLKVKLPTTWSKASLTFYQWYDVNLTFDWTEIRINGKVVKQTCKGSKPSTLSWALRTIDLSSYVGKTITVKFVFMASSVVNFSGWYIDDLAVSGS